MMQIETASLIVLREDPGNTRTHPERNMEAIKASLERFGQVEPLVVRTDGTVIGGNGRLRAMRELGWTKAEIVRVDVDDSQARALGVALNRTAELAEWDSGRLHAVLQDMPDLSEMLQFDAKELKHIEFDAQVGGGEVEEDEVPEPPGQAVTKLGEVWTLGKHTVVCGDCVEKKGPVAELGLHDPPYGISILSTGVGDGKWYGGMLQRRNKFDRLEGDDKPFDPSHLFDTVRVLVLWGANHYADRLPASAAWLIWDKRVDLPSNDFSDAEMAWVSKGGSVRIIRHRWNGLIRDSERGERRVHPTQKPVVVQAEIISRYTTATELVADWYLGSGTTLIAAEQLGRVCYGIEIEPRYVDVTIERWQNLTGGKAVRKSA